MPVDNQFRHQDYFAPDASSNHRLLQPQAQPAPNTESFDAAMRSAARSLKQANVAAIYLVHGTVAGTDATGLHRAIFSLLPGLGAQLNVVRKQVFDAIFGDVGNYDDKFLNSFRKEIQSAALDLPIYRFLWTSENHHLGRADAAVRLIDELSQLSLQPQQRVMLWGHSHAGNVFALLTNLVGGNRASRISFLEATSHFQPHGAIDRWDRVRRLLRKTDGRLWSFPLDIVTFGTPIRYGWETLGYAKLLHIINHHVLDADRPTKLPFPPSTEQILAAAAGDYFQQIFVAGTDFIPNPWAWQTRQLNRRLGQLVQHNVNGSLLERLQQGKRVPDEGLTLLVDYAAASSSDARLLAGHGIYTRVNWLPFHLAQILEQFYGGQNECCP